MIRIVRGARTAVLAFCVAGACVTSEAAAQNLPDANRGKIALSGSFDLANAYMFRGLRQDDTRVIMWPAVDAGINLHDGTGGLKNITLHIGTWNSLHTGVTGTQGPTGKLWYESDLYGTLAFRLDPGITASATYTAYMSPNNSFSSVRELSFKVAADDQDALFGLALKPYALIAFELDTQPGLGQADGGVSAGRYLEIGIAPTWSDGQFTFAVPIKEGLSLDHYYELAGVDHTFGFLSIGATATVGLGSTTSYGGWNVHGGLEFMKLGDTPAAFNAGDQTKTVASIGIGFSY